MSLENKKRLRNDDFAAKEAKEAKLESRPALQLLKHNYPKWGLVWVSFLYPECKSESLMKTYLAETEIFVAELLMKILVYEKNGDLALQILKMLLSLITSQLWNTAMFAFVASIKTNTVVSLATDWMNGLILQSTFREFEDCLRNQVHRQKGAEYMFREMEKTVLVVEEEKQLKKDCIDTLMLHFEEMFTFTNNTNDYVLMTEINNWFTKALEIHHISMKDLPQKWFREHLKEIGAQRFGKENKVVGQCRSTQDKTSGNRAIAGIKSIGFYSVFDKKYVLTDSYEDCISIGEISRLLLETPCYCTVQHAIQLLMDRKSTNKEWLSGDQLYGIAPATREDVYAIVN